ncbi:hypothetical protein HK405_001958, partial [Cladochytrium tenue]
MPPRRSSRQAASKAGPATSAAAKLARELDVEATATAEASVASAAKTEASAKVTISPAVGDGGATEIEDNDDDEDAGRPAKKARTDAPAPVVFGTAGSDWKVKWNVHDSLLVGTCGPQQSRPQIAGFDLDDTLTEPASGLTFSRDASDWRFTSDRVVARVRAAAATHRVV